MGTNAPPGAIVAFWTRYTFGAAAPEQVKNTFADIGDGVMFAIVMPIIVACTPDAAAYAFCAVVPAALRTLFLKLLAIKSSIFSVFI
jgi:hypothetical protein